MDVFNKPSRKETDADWINGLLRRFSSSLGFFLNSLDQWKHFRVWARAKVLQDCVDQVGGEFDFVHGALQGKPVAVTGFFFSSI